MNKKLKSAFFKVQTKVEINSIPLQPDQLKKDTIEYTSHHYISVLKSGEMLGLRTALRFDQAKNVPFDHGSLSPLIIQAEPSLYDIVSDSARLEVFVLPLAKFDDIPLHITVSS